MHHMFFPISSDSSCYFFSLIDTKNDQSNQPMLINQRTQEDEEEKLLVQRVF